MLGEPALPRGRPSAPPLPARARCARADGRLLRTWRGGHAHTSPRTSRTTRTSARRWSTSTRRAAPEALPARGGARWPSASRRTSRAEDGGFFSTAARPRVADRAPPRGPRRRDPQRQRGGRPAAGAALVPPRTATDLREDGAWRAARLRQAIARQPRAFAKSLSWWTSCWKGPIELAFVGAARRAASRRCAARWAAHYLPNRIVGPPRPGRGPRRPAAAARARTLGGRPGRALRVPRLRLPAARHRPGRGRRRAGRPRRRAAAAPGAPLGPAPLPGRATAEGTARLRRRASPAAPTGYGPLGTHRAPCQPRRLRRLPRGRRDAAPTAPRCAQALRSRLQPDRHVDELHRRRQRAPGRPGRCAELIARRRPARARRSSSSPRSATCRARTSSWPGEREEAGPARSRRW